MPIGNDPDKLIDDFLDHVRAAASLVTSDGYDEGARKFSCHARLKMSVGGRDVESDASYTSQATEDNGDSSVVRLSHATVEELANQIAAAAKEQWYRHRYTGDWAGTHSCQGIDGAVDGLKGPFSRRVYLQIDGLEGKLERTTRGGGIEKLRTTFDANGEARLDGAGENTPDDRWGAHFEGQVTGRQLLVQGNLIDSEGSHVLRKCTIELTKGSAGGARTVAPNS